jgi:hypothetical protein
VTMKRGGSSWMPAEEYGKSLPKFSVNLLVVTSGRSACRGHKHAVGPIGPMRPVAQSFTALAELLGIRLHS